ncbi:Uncharacterised protein [Mycobacteroides abscessus subsp. abscessus]|nr:Uncharacterised protein [Mycobacteroides abscessus subsp. abscessus]
MTPGAANDDNSASTEATNSPVTRMRPISAADFSSITCTSLTVFKYHFRPFGI